MSFPARLFVASIPFFVACSSSSGASSTVVAADPTPPDTTSTTDVHFLAIANSSAERIVEASFAVPPPGPQSQCTTEVVAGCVVATCTNGGTTPTRTIVDPGALSASSTTLGDAVAVSMTAGYGRVVQEGMWPAGESVELKGAGGADIPAFDVTATIPPVAGNLAVDGCNSNDPNAPCALSASGSVATWQNAAGANLVLSLFPSLQTPTLISATCRYPGDGGAGRIPAEVIAKLSPGAQYGASITTRSNVYTLVKGATHTAAVGAERIFLGGGLTLKTPG